MGGIIWIIGLFVLVALVAVILVRRGPFRRLGVDESVLPEATAVTDRIRLRNAIALVAAIVVATALVWFALSVPSDQGRTLFVAPALSAATGILFFAVIPAFRENVAVRSADLEPRTPLSFANRRSFVVAGVLVLGVLVASIIFGVVAAADGRSITRDGPLYAFSSSPFPGFFYGAPVLAAMALLIGVVVLAIVRIANAPRPSNVGLRDADASMRALAIGVVLRAAAAGSAATLAAMLMSAAPSSQSVSGGIDENGVNGPRILPDTVLQTIAIAEQIAAAVLLVVALVFAIAAITGALRKPLQLSAVPA